MAETTTTAIRTRTSRPSWSGWRIFLRWLVAPAATILIAAFLVFAALALAPGDPINQILGGKASDEQREALRERLGLNLAFPLQFLNWIVRAVQGDLGVSFTHRQDVVEIIAPRLGTTLALVSMSTVLILVIGIGGGILGGVFRRARPWVAFGVALLISVPSFVAASFLVSTFAVSLRWFPTFGAGQPGLDRIWHLTLPAIALSVGWIAFLAQISMASISEERSKEHVTTAIGRGLPFAVILRKHILRNAGIPVVTASGLMLAALLAGAVVVETAFAVDGVGSLLVTSVLAKDQPVVAAISLLIIAAFVIMTTIVDILHVLLDPTLRETATR